VGVAKAAGIPTAWRRPLLAAVVVVFLLLTAVMFGVGVFAGKHLPASATGSPDPRLPPSDRAGLTYERPRQSPEVTGSLHPAAIATASAGAHPVSSGSASSGSGSTASRPASAPVATSPRPRKSVPVAPPGVNLALNRPVRATNHTQYFVAANVTDGRQDTYWEAASGFPRTLTIDLGSEQTVGRLELELPASSDWNRRTQTITVLGSDDGSGWHQIAGSRAYTFDANATGADRVSAPVARTSARYLRLSFTANSGWGSAQLSELGVYS
jgi:hypothetical protein